MTLSMYTTTGEQHGIINTLTNSVPFDDFKHMTPENKEKFKKEKKEDSRLVKVKYINTKGRHERLTKPYCRWSGDSIIIYHLIPNYVYTVPMGFVKEVNEIEMPKRSGLVSVDGSNINNDGSPIDKDQKGEQVHMLVPADF